jgi:hypothetical protein
MTKDDLLVTMRTERAEWEALLAKADETRMIQPGAVGEWSLKDIIAHVTAYEQGLVRWLEGASLGEVVVFPDDLDHPDLDHRNALIFAQNQHRLLADIEEESQRVFRQLLALVEGLSGMQLLDADRTEWFVRPRWHEKRPLWQCIADDSYRHYRQHVRGIRSWLDDMGSNLQSG